MKIWYLIGAVIVLFSWINMSPAISMQNTYLVTNTADSGPGSLREGLSNPEATIQFNIPKTDPGYDPVNGVWVIKPSITYNVPPGKTIDGRIALLDGGFRPGIEIDGTLLGQIGYSGFFLNKGAALRGFIIHSCTYGIWIADSDVTVTDCYIGTDASGSVAKPNRADGILFIGAQNGHVENNLISGNRYNGIRISGRETGSITIVRNRIGTDASGNAAIPNKFHGISIHADAKQNFIEDNLISGNNFNGISLSGDSTMSNTIRGNKIGTNAAGTAALRNGNVGIELESGSKRNLIEDNLISGNAVMGIHLKDAGTDFNLIRRNRIGCDTAGATAIPNGNYGVALFNGPRYNVIGQDNLIAFNGITGVLIDGANSFSSTINNTITQNRIFANGVNGINTMRGGNIELAPPVIKSVSATQISGTAGPMQTVEVFADENGQGRIFIASTSTDAAGNFILPIAGLPNLPNITATATDMTGNTSAFSKPMNTRIEPIIEEDSVPLIFNLCQNHPNPFNPITVIEYHLPQAADVELAVYTLSGHKVSTLVKNFQAAGAHRAVWDGCDESGASMPSGVYLYRLTAGDFTAAKKMLRVK